MQTKLIDWDYYAFLCFLAFLSALWVRQVCVFLSGGCLSLMKLIEKVFAVCMMPEKMRLVA